MEGSNGNASASAARAPADDEWLGADYATYEAAIAALNAAFLAFLTKQLATNPSADYSEAAKEYVEYARWIRARFSEPELEPVVPVYVPSSSPAYSPTSPPYTSPYYVPPAEAPSSSSFGGFSFGSSSASDQPASSSGFISPFAPFGAPTQPKKDEFAGFLASANTYGASSIWTDPKLLQLRLDADAVERKRLVFSSESSEVWRGVWKGTTPVALKRLAPARQTMACATVIATNITAVATLRHPRILSLCGVEWAKAPELQVATEFMEGGDLRSLLDSPESRQPLTWEYFKCQVAIDIVDALAFVHAQPTRLALPCLPSSRKVLISSEGRAKLNLVQASDLGDHRRSQPVRYMAPEVIKGGGVSDAADMYALGVLLCELDSTQVPYDNETNQNGAKMENELIAQQVVKGMLKPTPSAECPGSIKWLIALCVSYEPAVRPTAATAAYTLREILKNDL